MLAYYLLIFFIIGLGACLCEIKKSSRNNAIFLCVSSIGMIIMSFLRANTVGIDYVMYEEYFQNVRKQGWSFLISEANGYRIEPGYSLLNYLVSLFTGDVHIFMLVVSIITVGLTAILLYKYSAVPWVGMFVFVSFGFFGNTLSFIRQSIAIAIFLFSIKYLKEKKFLPYLLIVLLAASFHKSILIMIPMYLIAHIKVNWKSLTSYAVVTSAIMALSWPLFNFITKFVFKYYATKEGLYFMRGRNWQTALIPVVTTIAVLILKKYILQRDPNNVVLINFSIYSALLYIMTCQHFLFQRFGIMFFTSAILLIPELVKSVGDVSEIKEELNQVSAQKVSTNKSQKKKMLQEQRKLKSNIKWKKYYYFDAVTSTVVFGFLYNAFLLNANRINLTPYITFFIHK